MSRELRENARIEFCFYFDSCSFALIRGQAGSSFSISVYQRKSAAKILLLPALRSHHFFHSAQIFFRIHAHGIEGRLCHINVDAVI